MLKTFRHEEQNIHKALGMDDDIKISVREKIFFSTFSNAIVVEELYDDMDDAPPQLSTVTGILEKCIGLSTEEEYDYMLLTFHNSHELANAAYKHYKLINADNEDKEMKVKIKILEMLSSIKELSSEEKEKDVLHPSDLMKRIILVKKSNYNYEKYIHMLNEMSN